MLGGEGAPDGEGLVQPAERAQRPTDAPAGDADLRLLASLLACDECGLEASQGCVEIAAIERSPAHVVENAPSPPPRSGIMSRPGQLESLAIERILCVSRHGNGLHVDSVNREELEPCLRGCREGITEHRDCALRVTGRVEDAPALQEEAGLDFGIPASERFEQCQRLVESPLQSKRAGDLGEEDGSVGRVG